MGDGDYLFAFQHVVMPVAYAFDPDMVISTSWDSEGTMLMDAVAAGFDAAQGDQLGGCFVTPPCYAHMTHMLMSLANGKVVVCLEVRVSDTWSVAGLLKHCREATICEPSRLPLWQSHRP